MVAIAYLTSTLVMALLVVGVVVLVLRGRRWRHYTPQAAYAMDAGGGSPTAGLARIAASANTWTVAYVLLVVGVLAGAFVALTGAVSETGMIAGFGAALLVYVVVGVYAAMRTNGRSSAQAVGASAVTLGFLLILAVSAKLFLGL